MLETRPGVNLKSRYGGEVLDPPSYQKKQHDSVLAEIRELIGDGNGAVSGAAILDILERHGFA